MSIYGNNRSFLFGVAAPPEHSRCSGVEVGLLHLLRDLVVFFLPSQQRPEGVVMVIIIMAQLIQYNDRSLAGTIAIQADRDIPGVVLLKHPAVLALPLEDGEAIVQNKGVAVIEGVGGERDFCGTNLVALVAGDTEQAALVFLRDDRAEAGFDSSLEDDGRCVEVPKTEANGGHTEANGG